MGTLMFDCLPNLQDVIGETWPTFVGNIIFNLFRQVKTLCILQVTQGAHPSSVPILPVQTTKGKITFWHPIQKTKTLKLYTQEIAYPTPRKFSGNYECEITVWQIEFPDGSGRVQIKKTNCGRLWMFYGCF